MLSEGQKWTSNICPNITFQKIETRFVIFGEYLEPFCSVRVENETKIFVKNVNLPRIETRSFIFAVYLDPFCSVKVVNVDSIESNIF